MEKQRAWYRLSAAFVANATAPGRRFHDGGGLYLIVRKTARATGCSSISATASRAAWGSARCAPRR